MLGVAGVELRVKWSHCFNRATGSAESFDPELTTEGLTADGLVAGRNA
jgi:hypothetical protein